MKKIPETDAIFENVHQVNQESDQNSKSLRISIDSKAKVKIGNLSRNGKSRNLVANVADDHDHVWSSVLVPFGILNLETNKLSIYFGSSAETSDFIVDCLNQWWKEHKDSYKNHEELVIDRVSVSAKTLSGFGYRGHIFWDTEVFILPFFTFTQPAIASSLLTYRYHTLAGARRKALHSRYQGAAPLLNARMYLPFFCDISSDRLKTN